MIYDNKLMNPLFEILEQCKGVEQLEQHHPEGDVNNAFKAFLCGYSFGKTV